MKIAVFSSKSYDIEYFTGANGHFGHEITFFEARLKQKTAHLAEGYEAVCVFVNDVLDRETILILRQHNVRIIALRAAGFNNVDVKTAMEQIAGTTLQNLADYREGKKLENEVVYNMNQ